MIKKIKDYFTGFTLIELVVVVAIIAILSSIILFSVGKYVSKGKDSNIQGNLAVLVPAGEVFYNANSNSYETFCESDVVKNTFLQMPKHKDGSNADIQPYCSVESQFNNAWAACYQQFSDLNTAFCVDSRGIKKEICNSSCVSDITVCPTDGFPDCN